MAPILLVSRHRHCIYRDAVHAYRRAVITYFAPYNGVVGVCVSAQLFFTSRRLYGVRRGIVGAYIVGPLWHISRRCYCKHRGALLPFGHTGVSIACAVAPL